RQHGGRAHRLVRRHHPFSARRSLAARTAFHCRSAEHHHRRQYGNHLTSPDAARLPARQQVVSARHGWRAGQARGLPAVAERGVRADSEHDALLYKRVVPHQLPAVTGGAGDKGRIALPVAVLAALGACVALAGDKQPREYLDEETAATITVV